MKCRKCGISLPEESKFCLSCGAKQTPGARRPMKRPNGTGTVYKLQGRRKRPWVAAKNKVVIGYFETRTAALEALNRLAGRTVEEAYNMTFAQVFAAWKAEHYREISQSAKETYDHAFSGASTARNSAPCAQQTFRLWWTSIFTSPTPWSPSSSSC